MIAATYPCGHPRTPENTNKRQCRTCRARKRRERYASDPVFAEAERARSRSNYDALEGVAYSRLLLLNRRRVALYRRQNRDHLRNPEG